MCSSNSIQVACKDAFACRATEGRRVPAWLGRGEIMRDVSKGCEVTLTRGDTARGVTCGEARTDAACPRGEVGLGQEVAMPGL